MVFYIRNIRFNIKGRTREWALLRKAEIKRGEKITGKTKLEKYFKNKEQTLINTRIVELAVITYTLGTPEENEIPVDMLIKTEDTRNVIALPEPKYSSSSGLDMKLKIRDYNFLGTMGPLRLDIGYILDDEHWPEWDEGAFTVSIDSGIPFEFLGFRWNFNFDHDFSYTFEEPLYYKNTTGISMDIPWKRTTFTVGFEENFVFNEKNGTAYQDEFGEFIPFYMASSL
jgi:outer membrane protein assembly factor BamA